MVRYLSGCSGLEGTSVTSEYKARYKPVPLTRPLVAVGFESLSVERGGFSDYMGTVEGDSVSGRQVAITLRLDIAVPKNQGGSGCHAVFESLCQGLLVTPNSFGVTGMRCREVTYDKEAGGFVLTATASMTALLTTRYSEENFTDFVITVKEKGATVS